MCYFSTLINIFCVIWKVRFELKNCRSGPSERGGTGSRAGTPPRRSTPSSLRGHEGPCCTCVCSHQPHVSKSCPRPHLHWAHPAALSPTGKGTKGERPAPHRPGAGSGLCRLKMTSARIGLRIQGSTACAQRIPPADGTWPQGQSRSPFLPGSQTGQPQGSQACPGRPRALH